MTAKVMAALVAAQQDLRNPSKDAKADTGQFSYSYATLPTVLELVRPVLAKHGLAIAQDVRMDEGRVEVFTLVFHSSGEQLLFGPIVGRSGGGKWQELGSAISFARRYGLMAALSLSGDDDDDDANTIDAQPATIKRPTRVKATKPEPEADPWATPAVPEALEGLVADEAPIMVPGNVTGPLRSTWGQDPASEAQRKLLALIAKEQGYENTAAFLASEDVRQLIGGTCSTPIKKGHAKPILDHYRGAK